MPHMHVVLLLCIRSWLFETCSYSYDTKSVQYLTNGFVGKSDPGFKRVSTVITNCGIGQTGCEWEQPAFVDSVRYYGKQRGRLRLLFVSCRWRGCMHFICFLGDSELIKLCGCSKNSYYKYKRLIRQTV